MRYEIRFSGSGGQGIITAGIILAKAVSIEGGKNAVQSQSYGPEARGGASKAEVIISDDEINYPKVTNPDMFVALNQESYDKYSDNLKNEAIAIVDASYVRDYGGKPYKIYPVPLIEEITARLGSDISVNIAVLGAVNALGKIISDEAILKTIAASFPKKAEESNRSAYEIGKSLAEAAERG